jgi:hypothetical protein
LLLSVDGDKEESSGQLLAQKNHPKISDQSSLNESYFESKSVFGAGNINDDTT